MSAIILRRMLGEKVWAGGDPVLELMMREVQETDEPEKQASLCRKCVGAFVCLLVTVVVVCCSSLPFQLLSIKVSIMRKLIKPLWVVFSDFFGFVFSDFVIVSA